MVRTRLSLAFVLAGLFSVAMPIVGQGFAPMFAAPDSEDLNRPLVPQSSRDKDAWLLYGFKAEILRRGLTELWNSLPHSEKERIVSLEWEVYVDRREQEAEERWFKSVQSTWGDRDVQVWNSLQQNQKVVMQKLIVGQYVENEKRRLLAAIDAQRKIMFPSTQPVPGQGFVLGYKPPPPQEVYTQYLAGEKGQPLSGDGLDHVLDKAVPNFQRVHEAADFRRSELEKVEAEMDRQEAERHSKPEKGPHPSPSPPPK